MRKQENQAATGYGAADRKLAADLAKAATPAEADRIARDGGLRDAKDARSWLKSRSG
jgi:hypothetical protein